MSNNTDYDKIISDKNLFNNTVYTKLSDAVKILEERQKDKKLKAKIEKLLENDIPEPFCFIDKYAVNGKQIATPNFDVRFFLNLVNEEKLKPLFWEFYDDKFTSNNPFKYSLGKLIIFEKIKSKIIKRRINIIDFNKYDGKKLRDIKTIWGESLINFHKRLFNFYGYNTKKLLFYDGSYWLNKHGKEASSFYEKDLLLYVYHGILFENYILNGKEGEFTKNIFLKSFLNVQEITGCKPLIVPIPPMDKDIEEDEIWFSYDEKIKNYNL